MRRICISLLLTVAAAAAGAWAQSAAKPRAGKPSPSFISHVNEVRIVFSARDKKHRYITGLTPNYLHVYDNSHPQKIQQLLADSNAPLRLAMVIDTSTSVRTRFRFEQQAAISFLETVLRPNKDKAMIVAFDTSVIVAQPMTGDKHKLAKAIRGLAANGGTALYDAVYYTMSQGLLKSGKSDVRRAMVLISDGEDDASQPGMRKRAIALAESAGVVIFAISTDPTGIDARDDRIMRSFSVATGGEFFFPFRANQLGRMFTSIAYELSHEYVLTYVPDDFVLNGAFHKVRIKPISGNIVISARKGYYAVRTP